MSKFALHDASGKILHLGECPDGLESLQVINDLNLYIGEAELHDNIDMATGTLVKGEPPKPSYRQLRQSAYPRIADQLDALWHAMDRGDLPIAPEFYQMVDVVKRKYPKPEAIPETSL